MRVLSIGVPQELPSLLPNAWCPCICCEHHQSSSFSLSHNSIAMIVLLQINHSLIVQLFPSLSTDEVCSYYSRAMILPLTRKGAWWVGAQVQRQTFEPAADSDARRNNHYTYGHWHGYSWTARPWVNNFICGPVHCRSRPDYDMDKGFTRTAVNTQTTTRIYHSTTQSHSAQYFCIHWPI